MVEEPDKGVGIDQELCEPESLLLFGKIVDIREPMVNPNPA